MFTSNDEEGELTSKMSQVTRSLTEKIAVLDARDKAIRLRRERQTNIETAKAVLGTCPDMCPEFERYFREETNQLSPLETSDGRESDPHAMVKEYRRAGADQEEPLPHELRPPAVLLRTMDYLVCNIMDRFERDPSQAGEWYDFVWSRLRAIRKDITQQHLCDEASVELLEKCARFHIYCAHSLCEEDVSVFDQKINNENLSKCIQSLKDFYYDLSLKGITCENEAEFCGYDILLNIKDGDILRKLRHLPKKLRETKEVQFAINIYNAFIGNNFIKFFKLIEETTYLNSCILHRFFNQIRFQALKILRKSFCIANQREQYPANQLLTQLGFNDGTELQQFCDAVGLSYNEESILLTRDKSITNLNDIPVVRAQVIERKRHNVSVGEIVNARPLPNNPYKQFPLHNSFDAAGKLKDDAVHAEDQKPKSDSQKEFPAFDSQSMFGSNRATAFNRPLEAVHVNVITTPKPEPLYSEQIQNKVVVEIAEKIFNSVLDSIFSDVVSEIIVNQKTVSFMSSIFSGVLKKMIRDVCVQVYTEAKEQHQRQLELDATKRIGEEFIEKLISDETLNLTKSIAKHAYYAEFRLHVTTQTSLILDDLLQETVRAVVGDIGKQCYQAAVEEREKLVAQMKAKHDLRLARKYTTIWRVKCIYAQRYRYFREKFPASSVENLPMQAKLLQLPNVSVKRKQSNSDSGRKMAKCALSDTAYVRLVPHRFAERVYNLTQPDRHVSLDSPSIETLREALEEEKQLSQRYSKTLDILKRSFDFSTCDDQLNEKT